MRVQYTGHVLHTETRDQYTANCNLIIEGKPLSWAKWFSLG